MRFLGKNAWHPQFADFVRAEGGCVPCKYLMDEAWIE
jgi:hypothetical protein